MSKETKWVICPKWKDCIEDCECKEPHKLEDCMCPQPQSDDGAFSESCKIKCVPTNKRPEIEKVKVEHLTILYDGGRQ